MFSQKCRNIKTFFVPLGDAQKNLSVSVLDAEFCALWNGYLRLFITQRGALEIRKNRNLAWKVATFTGCSLFSHNSAALHFKKIVFTWFCRELNGESF